MENFRRSKIFDGPLDVGVAGVFLYLKSPSSIYLDVTHTRWEIRDSRFLRVYEIAVRDCNFYLNVTEAKWEIHDSTILRVYKKRDFKIFRDSKILLVYKIAVRDFNFYVDVTEAKWEIRDFKLFAYFEAVDLR